jgi:hypothetical protein
MQKSTDNEHPTHPWISNTVLGMAILRLFSATRLHTSLQAKQSPVMSRFRKLQSFSFRLRQYPAIDFPT